MDAVFLKLLNMSIAASWLALAVMVLRLLLKKAPRWMCVCLWGIVGIRLVLPYSLSSIFSLVPSTETLPKEILLSPMPQIQSGVSAINNIVNPVLGGSLAPNPGDSVNPMQVLAAVGWNLWLVGMVVMLCYMTISYFRVAHRVRESVRTEENVFESERVESPFLLGVIRPRIYLPLGMEERDREYVLAHERAHLRGGDHIWKLLGFLLLAVNWYNPILWAAYLLLCRDIEFACDERVMKRLGAEAKKPYSEALLHCSTRFSGFAVCPLAFGEIGVKQRIKGILSYKKPTLWVLLGALLICTVAVVCFLTDPPEPPKTAAIDVDTPASFTMGTDCEGVTLAFVAASPDNRPPEVILKWKNDTGGTLTILPQVRAYRDGEQLEQYAKIDYVSHANVTMGEEYTDSWAIIGFGESYVEEGITKIGYNWPSGYYRFERDFTDGNGMKHTAFVEFQIDESRQPTAYGNHLFYDSIYYDIDFDGVAERCAFGMGPTSGLFTFTITVSENGKEECFNIFHSPYYYLSFQISTEGNLQVVGVTQGEDPESHTFDMTIEDGNIVLTDVEGHKDAMLGYWGEQGIESRFLP